MATTANAADFGGESLKSDCNLPRHSTYCLRTTAGPAMLRLCKSSPSFDVVHVVLAAATCRIHTSSAAACPEPPICWLCMHMDRRCCSMPAGSVVLLKFFATVACLYQDQRSHAKAAVVVFTPFDALHKAFHLQHTFVRLCNSSTPILVVKESAWPIHELD